MPRPRHRARGAARRRPSGRATWSLRRGVGTTTTAVRDVGSRVVEGDRPLLLGLLGLLVVCVVMLSGPLQAYWDGHSRVALLERKHEALTAEVARLEDRQQLLQDPAQIELLAREEQGFIRPGETPYVVVPPQVDAPVIEGPEAVAEQPVPWYRRVWDAVADLVG